MKEIIFAGKKKGKISTPGKQSTAKTAAQAAGATVLVSVLAAGCATGNKDVKTSNNMDDLQKKGVLVIEDVEEDPVTKKKEGKDGNSESDSESAKNVIFTVHPDALEGMNAMVERRFPEFNRTFPF